MAFDGILTKAIAEELQQLSGARVDKVFEPNSNTIVLRCYFDGNNYALNICTSSPNYRIHLTTHPKPNPMVAPNFCMVLRKHLIGLRIKNIITTGLERIVTIEFARFDNIVCKKLIVELMGKHCNIILLDENDIIIDSLRHINNENSPRVIVPHVKYIYPEKSNYNETNSSIIDFVNSPDFKNAHSQDVTNFSLNFLIDDFYYEKESIEELKTYRNTVLKLILSTLKKYNKRLQNINKKLQDCADMEKFKLYGELITANLYKIPNKNVDKIQLENYYDNNNLITIQLDPAYTPALNAKKFFKKYNKLKNALNIVSIQKEETLKELDYIESIVYELEAANSIEEISYIYDEISENVIFKPNVGNYKKKKNTKIKKSNLTTNKLTNFNLIKYTIDRKFTLLVGRNNKENDYLTLKYAKKSDLWFHTKDIHGSHAVLILNNNVPPSDVLQKCAEIVAFHSKAKFSSNVAVDYCEVKYVKKPHGAKPGMVIYSNNSTLYVTPKEI